MPIELTEYQGRLLEKISEIEDADILNLLADGAQARVRRYDENISPAANKSAREFQNRVESLYTNARRANSKE